MIIYPEIKEFAKCFESIRKMVEMLNFDYFGFDSINIDFNSVYFVFGLSERGMYLFKGDEKIAFMYNGCYIEQIDVYAGCFFGCLYFKTDVPGEFVAIYFHAYLGS